MEKLLVSVLCESMADDRKKDRVLFRKSVPALERDTRGWCASTWTLSEGEQVWNRMRHESECAQRLCVHVCAYGW